MTISIQNFYINDRCVTRYNLARTSFVCQTQTVTLYSVMIPYRLCSIYWTNSWRWIINSKMSTLGFITNQYSSHPQQKISWLKTTKKTMQKTIFRKLFTVFALFIFLTGKTDTKCLWTPCHMNFMVILEAESFVMSMRNKPRSDDYQMPLTYNGIFKRTFQDYFDGMSTYEMK